MSSNNNNNTIVKFYRENRPVVKNSQRIEADVEYKCICVAKIIQKSEKV